MSQETIKSLQAPFNYANSLLKKFIEICPDDIWQQIQSTALFYRKIRQIIMYHLDQDVIEVFQGQIELDESYFGGVRKENVVEVLQAR